MKLVILILFFAILPAACSPVSVIEDVNGDAKIDMVDVIQSGVTGRWKGKESHPHA